MNRQDLALFDFYLAGDFYTFAGYPWRKSKATLTTVSTQLTSYTGEAVAESTYKALGYSPAYHVIIKFRRKKAFHLYTGRQQLAAMPHGISGGAVFSWQKDLAMAPRKPELRCTAIGHTYKHREQLLIGTRLQVYMGMIQLSHREIFRAGGERFNPDPILMGLVWYRRDEWNELMRDFDDAANMQASWEEWRHQAEKGIEEMAIRGGIPVPVEVTAQEIRDFCAAKNLRNNGHTRASLINAKMAEQLTGTEIEKPKMHFPIEFVGENGIGGGEPNH